MSAEIAKQCSNEDYVKDEDASTVTEKLQKIDFKRKLKEHQLSGLSTMLSNPNSANFSVPGAGKTTVAIALNDLLDFKYTIIIVPNKQIIDNAWLPDMKDCLSDYSKHKTFVIEGGSVKIERILKDFRETGGYAFITYAQSPKVGHLLKKFMIHQETHLILDESHHMKGAIAERYNQQSLQGMAVLDLALYAKRRDILTGTPMPQGVYDIASQFEFLYPYCGISNQIIDNPQNPGVAIKGYWTRTTKSHMMNDLPKTITHDPIGIEMSDKQYLFYDMVISRYKLIYTLLRRNQMFGDIRAAVKRIQRISVDPYSLAEDLLNNKKKERDEFRDQIRGSDERAILQAVLDEKKLDSKDSKISNKMFAAINKANEIIDNGQKVIVWGQFVSTNEKIARYFAEKLNLNWEEIILFSRINQEQKMENIQNFNKKTMDIPILIAHPKTGGEGISLHHNCRNAIYLDRSYDAREYLQSLDRIHRILPPGISKDPPVNYYFLRSLAPVRETIDDRISLILRAKIIRMGKLLDDPELNQLGLDEETGDELRSVRANNEADQLLKDVLGIE